MGNVKYNENEPDNNSSGEKPTKGKITLEKLQQNAAQDKAQIDALKNAIFHKIKSNGVAGKAALIISNWLERDSKNKPNKNNNKKSA